MRDGRVTGSGVTVVVPHYGDPGPTLRTIEDLRRQATARTVEVVVVDDCSPEPFPDPEGVTVVRRDTNGGFGSAVNSGVALATQPLLLVLNSDVTLDATFVDALVDAAEPWMPAVVGPLVRDPSGHHANSARHFPTVGHQAVEWLTPLARHRDRRLLREAVGHDTRAVPGAVLPVDWVAGVAMLLPVEVFRAVGGFDEGYFMNAEEVDLQRRLRAHGIPSVFVGTVARRPMSGAARPTRRRGGAGSWSRGCATRGRGVAGVGSLRRSPPPRPSTPSCNTGRRLAGRDVDPVATAREELRLDPRGTVVSGLVRRVVEAPPSVRWHLGRVRTVLSRRAFAGIGAGTVIVRPRVLRGVDRISLGSGCAVYEGAWLPAEGEAGRSRSVTTPTSATTCTCTPSTPSPSVTTWCSPTVSSSRRPTTTATDRSAVHGTGPVRIGTASSSASEPSSSAASRSVTTRRSARTPSSRTTTSRAGAPSVARQSPAPDHVGGEP